ncbi:hypothetical protein Hanom_Chr14g01273721 [Helianthus anomalus]
MEISMQEIISIRQEGTVFDYCSVFQSLFERVKNSEDMCEVYAIYLFIDGLEPRIREVFITWHQYSYHKVKDFISLALKIDANKLQDSFSPFDPKSSFYIKELVFDSRKSLDEIMEGNESFRDGKIQEISNEDRVFDESAYKVFDEMFERFDGKIQELGSESENDIKKELEKELYESDYSDKIVETTGVSYGTLNQNKSVETVMVDQEIRKKMLVSMFLPNVIIMNKSLGSDHQVKLGEHVRVLVLAKALVSRKRKKRVNWIDTGWFFNTKCKHGEIVELKCVASLVDKNKVSEVGLQLGSDLKLSDLDWVKQPKACRIIPRINPKIMGAFLSLLRILFGIEINLLNNQMVMKRCSIIDCIRSGEVDILTAVKACAKGNVCGVCFGLRTKQVRFVGFRYSVTQNSKLSKRATHKVKNQDSVSYQQLSVAGNVLVQGPKGAHNQLNNSKTSVFNSLRWYVGPLWDGSIYGQQGSGGNVVVGFSTEAGSSKQHCFKHNIGIGSVKKRVRNSSLGDNAHMNYLGNSNAKRLRVKKVNKQNKNKATDKNFKLQNLKGRVIQWTLTEILRINSMEMERGYTTGPNLDQQESMQDCNLLMMSLNRSLKGQTCWTIDHYQDGSDNLVLLLRFSTLDSFHIFFLSQLAFDTFD